MRGDTGNGLLTPLTRNLYAITVALAILTFLARHTAAQSGAVTLLDPSPRAAAMGGSGAALPGDDASNSFYNPALLGDVEGLRWGHSRTRLVPDFADSVYRRSDYILVGAGGIGISLDGRPFGGIGKSILDFGPSRIRDDLGNLGGTIYPYESVREFGLGFHGFGTVRHLAALAGITLPDVDRNVDLSFGFRWKKFALYPFGDSAVSKGYYAADSGKARDWGVLLRARPYHNIAGDYLDGEVQDGGPLAGLGGLDVQILGGYSSLNSSADPLRFLPFEKPYSLAKLERTGLGVVLTTGYPRFLQESEDGVIPTARKWLGPTLALSATVETLEEINYFNEGERNSVHNRGLEATFLDVVSLRVGHRDDDRGQIHASTAGFGLNLHFADAAAIRYDWATFPEADPLSRIHPWALSFTLNPYGMIKVLLGG